MLVTWWSTFPSSFVLQVSTTRSFAPAVRHVLKLWIVIETLTYADLPRPPILAPAQVVIVTSRC